MSNYLPLKAFGKRLRLLRVQAELSAAELAEHAGVSTSSVHRYLRGECWPDLPTAALLAEALDATVDELLDAPEVAA